MNRKSIYIDHNATTPLEAEVLEAMRPYLTENFGNASSMHVFGQHAKKGLEDAREAIGGLINAEDPSEIIFTGCGTEADNTAVKCAGSAEQQANGHIITSAIEHHAVLESCAALQASGTKITLIPVDGYGRVDPEKIRGALTPETMLVTVMHSNNEVGTIQPISMIGAMLAQENARRFAAGQPQVYFHTDAVQSAGKLPLDVRAMGVDLLSISAHKFYGPKGVGALYVKRGTPIRPLLHGGHHERNLRAGTENVAGIVGMAAALKRAVNGRQKEDARLLALRQKLEQGIKELIPEVEINGHPVERLANTLNVSFKYIEGESLLLMLDLEGIAASTGSACASGSSEPSHVLGAMGVAPDTAQGALRFSLGHQNTEEDINRILEVLPRTVARLRAMSPVWKQNQ